MLKEHIPICRAKIFGIETVRGFYAYDSVHNRHFILTSSMHGLTETRVDGNTLEMSFDEGISFATCSVIGRVLKSCEELVTIETKLEELQS